MKNHKNQDDIIVISKDQINECLDNILVKFIAYQKDSEINVHKRNKSFDMTIVSELSQFPQEVKTKDSSS